MKIKGKKQDGSREGERQVCIIILLRIASMKYMKSILYIKKLLKIKNVEFFFCFLMNSLSFFKTVILTFLSEHLEISNSMC